MLIIITFYSDENKIESLKQSASIHNLNILYHKINSWVGYYQKILEMRYLLENELMFLNNDDIICFIDAYDVLCCNNSDTIINTFKQAECDLLISGEMNCYPNSFISNYEKCLDYNLYKHQFINSGVYIGYKNAVKNMLYWHEDDGKIIEICNNKSGDQGYLHEYYFNKTNTDIVKIDYNNNLSLSMFQVNINDIILCNGICTYKQNNSNPCFIHFNGQSYNFINCNNIIPIFASKIKESFNNTTITFDEFITNNTYNNIVKHEIINNTSTRLLFTELNTFCINTSNCNNIWNRMLKRCAKFELYTSKWNICNKSLIFNNFASDMNIHDKQITQTHIRLWKHIIENNIEYALIFHDDILFDNKLVNRIFDWMNNIKDPYWDIIILNSDQASTPVYSWNIAENQYNMNAYIISKKCILDILYIFQHEYLRYDWMLVEIQKRKHSYIYFPWCTIQEDINDENSECRKIVRKLNTINYNINKNYK